jgi:hemoglobin
MSITKQTEITKENIHKMVMKFYISILKSDNSVSQVFKAKLGDDITSSTWKEHTELLTKFWTMMTIGEAGYKGNPMMAHIDLGLKSDMFDIWLNLFFKTVDSVYEVSQGDIFKARASNIAINFKRNLGI